MKAMQVLYLLTVICLCSVIGFAIHRTGSLWALWALLFIPSLTSERKGD